MPVYEYECEKCGTIVEEIQKFSDPPLTKCKHCSGLLHKLVSQSSFHLKGTGWYVTDYAKKKKPKLDLPQKNETDTIPKKKNAFAKSKKSTDSSSKK